MTRLPADTRTETAVPPTALRDAAEDMLKEIAFVLEMTRRAKEADVSDLPGYGRPRRKPRRLAVAA